MLSSPRNPDSTIRIFSSAENWRRVARRISLTTCSAGSFTARISAPIQPRLNFSSLGEPPSKTALDKVITSFDNARDDTVGISGKR
jgi:hypothetical protein